MYLVHMKRMYVDFYIIHFSMFMYMVKLYYNVCAYLRGNYSQISHSKAAYIVWHPLKFMPEPSYRIAFEVS